MDFVARAKRCVDAHVPDAIVALLTGSAASGTAKATSDLDIVAVIPAAPAPYRKTLVFEDQLVELFVSTPGSLIEYVKDDRRAALAHMCVSSVVLRGGDEAERIQEWARTIWDAGPLLMSEDERRLRRYRLSTVLDDLADASDPLEVVCIANEVFQQSSELVLAERRAWFGNGKWMARRLREAVPDVADRLLAAHQDGAGLADVAYEILEWSGGYLQEGFERQ